MLSISLDREGQEPLYNQLKHHLIRQIEDGVLLPGDRLPATRELADDLGIARISVVNAYEDLKQEGYIQAQVGRGTFVTERLPGLAGGSSALAGSVREQASVLRDMMRLADRPGVINFGHGIPANSFLPVELIRRNIDTVLVRDGAQAVAYEQPEGFFPLRQAVAHMVVDKGIHLDAADVLITGGCQQALDLAVQSLLNPGDVLLTGNPTYAGLLDIIHARGVIPVGVPLDHEGLRTDLLEDFIIEHRPRMLYVAPTFHNPTGTVMPLHRRRHLVEVAARYHLPVLEDAVYEDLYYGEKPPPPLKALDSSGLVLFASSFSKVLLPGMRIGYLLAGGRLLRRLVRVKSAADICTPSLNQRAIHLALEQREIPHHLSRVRAECRIRRAAMLSALQKYLPQAHWQEPDGGMYIWVSLPEAGPAAPELFIRAVEHGVAFAAGPLFFTDGQGRYNMRLNIGAYPPDEIITGIRRLAEAYASLVDSYQPPDQSLSSPLL